VTLRLVRITGGVVDLGDWGAVALTRAASALIRARLAPDVEMPESVAATLVDAALLLDDPPRRLLVLP
jgi:hypothetical protein